MKFELEPYYRNTSEAELLADVKDVAKKLGKRRVTIDEIFKYCAMSAISGRAILKLLTANRPFKKVIDRNREALYNKYNSWAPRAPPGNQLIPSQQDNER